MALIHDIKREIHAKIVYYGPGCSGKTTNLEYVYNKLKPEYRGAFKFMNTPHGRMVFFDFMRPELAGIKDYSLHFHLYTVPGNVENAALWKNVLKGVDGIVFVADLDPSRTLENVRSLESLHHYLSGHGEEFSRVPCIVQCNKKDLGAAQSPDDIRSLFGTEHIKFVAASARSGEGVLSVLSEMVKLVIQKLRDLPVGEEQTTEESVSESLPAADSAVESVSAVGEESEPLSERGEAFFPATMRFPSLAQEQPDHADTVELPAGGQDAAAVSGQGESLAEAAHGEESVLVSTELEMPAPLQETQDAVFPPADAAAEEEGTQSVPTEEEAGTPCALEEPTVHLEQGLMAVEDGWYRQTIVVRFGEKEKRFALTLSLTLE